MQVMYIGANAQLIELAKAHVAEVLGSDPTEYVQQLHANGNDSYRDTPSSKVQILPPVAAHQEIPETITAALTEYWRETLGTLGNLGSVSLSAVLSLNGPREKKEKLVECAQVVREFGESHSNLPLSYVVKPYSPDTKIGLIRRELYAVRIADLLHHNGDRLTDLALFNGDIDLSYILPGSLNEMYELSELGMPYVQALVRHAGLVNQDGTARYPNMDMVMSVYDMLVTMNGFARGTANMIRLKDYLAVGGFSPDLGMDEGNDLKTRIERLHRQRTGLGFEAVRAARAFVLTSPRRVYVAMSERGVPPTKMWGNAETFGMNDAYRARPLTDFTDISAAQRDSFIAEMCTSNGFTPDRTAVYDRLLWWLIQDRLVRQRVQDRHEYYPTRAWRPSTRTEIEALHRATEDVDAMLRGLITA